MDKTFLILISSLVLAIAVILGCSQGYQGFKGKVVFLDSDGDTILEGDFDRKGYRTLAKIRDFDWIDPVDGLARQDALLIRAKRGNESKLLAYSNGTVRTLFSLPSKRIVSEYGEYDLPEIVGACFGGSTQEIFYTVAETAVNDGSFRREAGAIYRLDLKSGKRTKLLDVLIGDNYMQFSKASNALLVTFDDSSEGSKPLIRLYKVKDKSLEKLVEGDGPVWLKDGQSFLFCKLGKDCGIYRYDIVTRQSKKVSSYPNPAGLTLSEDQKSLLAMGGEIDDEGNGKHQFVIISLASGEWKIYDWHEKFSAPMWFPLPLDY